MKRIVSLKKTTLDAIRDSEYIGNARIVNKLPKVGDKDKSKATPASVISVKKIKTEKGYSIYKVTYQYDDTIKLGKKGDDVEGMDTYYFTYAVKDGIHDDREEYCVMKNGNNIECFGSEKEAIPFAKKNKASKVLRVKYGNRNANGDEDELESESIWEEDSISGETWIDTPELLEEDDFKEGDLKEYWVINLNDIKDENIKLEVRIQTAEMMLDYLDDFKNRYVREEIEGDLRDFIKKNKTQKVHPKGSFKKIDEGKYTRREAEEPFNDSNGGIEELFKKAIVKKGNWYEFDEKALPKYQPRKFEWLAKSDNSCIVKYNGTEYYIYLNPTTGKLEVELN